MRPALAIFLSLLASGAGATRPQAYPTTTAPVQVAPADPRPAAKVTPKTAAEGCKRAGEAPTGWNPGKDVRDQCCAGTELREVTQACGQAYGGFASVCLACGDGTCDRALENSCNCPEDCKTLPK